MIMAKILTICSFVMIGLAIVEYSLSQLTNTFILIGIGVVCVVGSQTIIEINKKSKN